jgi:hypothetical protein
MGSGPKSAASSEAFKPRAPGVITSTARAYGSSKRISELF